MRGAGDVDLAGGEADVEDGAGGEAFDRFYAAVSRRLVGQAYLLTGSLPDAEDLAQEAMARAWREWHRDPLDREIEERLRAIAAVVEALPPAGRAAGEAMAGLRRVGAGAGGAGVRAGGRRRAAAPAPLALKGAVVLFAVLVAAGGLVAVLTRSGTRPLHRGGGVPTGPVGVLLPGGTGPCAGQAPGCGSPESSAAALAQGTWSAFPRGPLSSRSGQVEVWTGRELLVWGGAHVGPEQGTPGLVDDGAAYDPTSRTWRRLPPSPLSAREGAAAVWTGKEMIVVGGDRSIDAPSALSDAAAYDPSRNRWRRLPDFPLGPRTDASAIWTGTQLIVIGGMPRTGAGPGELESGAVYTPATGSWRVLPAMPALAGWHVLGVTPAWTGSALFVWVTWQRSGPCGPRCGFVYERETGYELGVGPDVWRTLGKPRVETNGAVTAWTGSGVLVMGGEYCPSSCPLPIGFGSDYDPAAGAWQAVPSFAVEQQWPAVWTGRAFIDDGVAGERHFGGPNVLRAYDPAARSWTTLQAPPGQIEQYAVPAVWTGRQLLVWGQPAEALTAGS